MNRPRKGTDEERAWLADLLRWAAERSSHCHRYSRAQYIVDCLVQSADLDEREILYLLNHSE
jgi:hypothetical protein